MTIDGVVFTTYDDGKLHQIHRHEVTYTIAAGGGTMVFEAWHVIDTKTHLAVRGWRCAETDSTSYQVVGAYTTAVEAREHAVYLFGIANRDK